MKLFVINEIGWEYNDSTYDRRGSNTVKAFKSRLAAEAEVARMNLEAMKSKQYRAEDERGYAEAVTEYFTLTETEISDAEMEDYLQARRVAEEAKHQQLGAARVVFTNASKQLFANHPALESFSWDQYAPGFNDGDPCVFSAHTDSPTINGLDDDYDAEDDAVEETNAITVAMALAEPVSEFLNSFAEEDLEAMFGDDARVVVHRDGTIDVDGCDHE